jgi:hypothetical protein
MRDQPATRLSWGRGKTKPGVTVWLGDRADETSNPVAISVSPTTIGPWFSFVRRRRTPEQLQRLAELLRTVPGAAPYFHGLEAANFSLSPSIPITEVLATDEQLEAWKRALAEASAAPH